MFECSNFFGEIQRCYMTAPERFQVGQKSNNEMPDSN